MVIKKLFLSQHCAKGISLGIYATLQVLITLHIKMKHFLSMDWSNTFVSISRFLDSASQVYSYDPTLLQEGLVSASIVQTEKKKVWLW